VTDDKHASEEPVEDSAARLATDTVDDDAAESPGRHAAADAPVLTAEDEAAAAAFAEPKRERDWSRIVAFALLPAVALLLAIGAGVLKFLDSGVRDSNAASEQAIQAAKDSTVALLSYNPDTVEQQLTSARDKLTGEFRSQYTDLTTNVVIPGAKEKQISAVATVPAAASVSADPGHAVVLLFVNQTVTVRDGTPTDTASSVRITLDKAGDRWLISQFEPV
jgi:Mce-associated membrane protein